MHPNLDKYICDRLPKIFAVRDLRMSDTCMCWGIETGDGWFYLVLELCRKMQEYLDQHPEVPQVVATQIKEKWSGLRFYYYGGDDYISGMVPLAEHLSLSICEECGVTHGVNPYNWKENDDPELRKIWESIKSRPRE
jgi:hypothetical protein